MGRAVMQRQDGGRSGGTGRRRGRPWRLCASARRDAEAAIERLSAERVRLEGRLADPAFYAGDRAAQIVAAQTRLAEIAREIEAAEAVWLEAEESLSEA